MKFSAETPGQTEQDERTAKYGKRITTGLTQIFEKEIYESCGCVSIQWTIFISPCNLAPTRVRRRYGSTGANHPCPYNHKSRSKIMG